VTALRFPSIPLTHGAQIRSAVLRTYSPYATSAVVNLRYYAEAADNSLPLAPTVGEFSRRPPTVNVVSHTPGPWVARTYNASPDLVAIIQETVDRPGWAPGNALTLFIGDDQSPSQRLIGSFETSPISTRTAVLEITVR
jgi:type IV pilus assembly protein PilY1